MENNLIFFGYVLESIFCKVLDQFWEPFSGYFTLNLRSKVGSFFRLVAEASWTASWSHAWLSGGCFSCCELGKASCFQKFTYTFPVRDRILRNACAQYMHLAPGFALVNKLPVVPCAIAFSHEQLLVYIYVLNLLIQWRCTPTSIGLYIYISGHNIGREVTCHTSASYI